MNALQQESEAGQAGLTSLGSAVTPASPYFPNVPLILLGALGFGAAIGALSGLLFELLNRRIRSEGDIVNGFDMPLRSEEHTSELQSLMRNSYAVFCLKKKKTK